MNPAAPVPVEAPPATFEDMGAINVDLSNLTLLDDVTKDPIPWNLLDHRPVSSRDQLYEKLSELITDDSVLLPCIMAHELKDPHLLADVIPAEHTVPIEADPLQ